MATISILPLDARASRFALRHHGLITRREAFRLGFSADQIAHRLKSGQWTAIARGVYVVGGAPPTPEHLALAACWSASSRAFSSHVTSCALFGLTRAPKVPHITVPRTASVRTRGVIVHRADLSRSDQTRIGVIPCTTVARSIVDAATMLDDESLADVVDEAIVRRLTSVRSIRGAMARASTRPGRKGLPCLESLLGIWAEGLVPGSSAEVRLLRKLDEWGFPPPVRQYRVTAADGTVLGYLDVAWPQYNVGLEYDGERWHTPRRWAKDEARHAAIASAGWLLRRCDVSDLRASSDRLRHELQRCFVGRPAA